MNTGGLQQSKDMGSPDQGSNSIAVGIARPWLAITMATGTVAVLELVRQTTVIRIFGAGAVSDAFYLGVAVPAAVGGAFQSIGVQVLMPWFCLSTVRDARKGHVHMSRLFFLLLLAMVAFVSISSRLAAGMAHWIAGPAIRQDLLAEVLRLSLPTLGLAAASATLSAYLYAGERFGVSALRRAVNSVFFIAMLLVWPSRRTASGLGLAYLAGSVVELVWLAFLARPSPRCMWSRGAMDEWRELGKLSASVALPSATWMVGALAHPAERMMAGYLTVGSVATLSYARRTTLALGRVLADGLNTVLRSKASRAYAEGAPQGIAAALTQGLRLMLLVLVPAATLVMTLRLPIAALLFGGALFEAGKVARTGAVIASFAAAIPAFGLVPLLLTPLYAAGDAHTPSVHYLLFLGFNLLLDLVAVRYLGILGIALAYLLAAILSALRAAWLLQRRGPRLQVWRDGRFFAALALGALCLSLASSLVYTSLQLIVPSGGWGMLLAAGISTLIGVATFALIETLLGVKELRLAARWARAQISSALARRGALQGGRTR